MTPRTHLDPELHTLRTVAQSVEGRSGRRLESARFNLFAALECSDREKAQRWSAALRTALLAEPDLTPELRASAIRTLDRIDAGVG